MQISLAGYRDEDSRRAGEAPVTRIPVQAQAWAVPLNKPALYELVKRHPAWAAAEDC